MCHSVSDRPLVCLQLFKYINSIASIHTNSSIDKPLDMFYIWTILFLGFLQINAQQWQSPCPDLFQYDPEGVQGDTWGGVVSLKTDQEISGVWMRLNFDRPPVEVGSDFGEVVQRESTDYLIRKPGHKLLPGDVQKIHVSVKFSPSEPAPQLKAFRLNARTICPTSAGNSPAPQPLPRLESPCPEIFNYETLNETDRWFGVIQLKSDTPLNGVWIRVILDRDSVQLGVSQENWLGEVTTTDNKEYLIRNPQFKLLPGVPESVRFFIKFKPGESIPKVAEIRQNAKTICPVSPSFPVAPQNQNPGIPVAARPAIIPSPPPTDDFFSGDFKPGSKPLLEVLGINDIECGTTSAQPAPLITYGQYTQEGEFPWHAALYKSNGTHKEYICGASLISRGHVLTVAHCVARPFSKSPVNKQSLIVVLGKYYLNQENPGIQTFTTESIIIHENYDHNTFKNDIAMIRITPQARYSDRIRPICLWSGAKNLAPIVDQLGTVVGWGFDQKGALSETLYKTHMPVVESQTCIYSYPEFFARFTNENTFCAGFRNQSSVCNGDSGGGMVFPVPGSPNKWQLRGLVSIGIALQNQAVCDTKHYAIFTDTAKYLDWISNNMK